MSTSAVVNVTVAGVQLTSPTNLMVTTAPANVTIVASVVDSAAISSVEFFVGTSSIGTDSTFPYSVNPTSIVAGVYSLTAKATDTNGLVLTSPPVTLIVDTDPTTGDRDGDGISDYDEWLQGRNPLVSGSVDDTNGIVNLRTFTPLR
jgi:hypothetical protein